ncbi:MAG: peptidoglycan-binding protein [Alphaproteobacteria bacterium]|nr:peptidoglycan-binding protein [Alphaproteobacteria bacterium]
MFSSSRRHRHSPLDIWPGFVDALATLLMVIIFVLMTFVVAQLYLTDALSNKDEALSNLSKKLDILTLALGEEKKQNQEQKEKNFNLNNLLEALKQQLAALQNDLDLSQTEKDKALEKNQSLLSQIAELTVQLKKLNDSLATSEDLHKEKDTNLKSLKEKLNATLAEKIEELKKLNEELQALKAANADLLTEQDKNKQFTRLGQFRSEFFLKLKQAIGNRSDMRIVGDRFVFQSEVLFEKASAELGEEGKKKLDQLAGALKEISNKIPTDLSWVLRVDGHTDRLPIHNQQFPSNWELSSARAISVVKYLIEKGIDSKHLVAAGFGEYQPLAAGELEQDLAKNRRIEFKLDQR